MSVLFWRSIESENFGNIRAEIVGFKQDKILLMPLDDTIGITPGSRVIASSHPLTIPVDENLIGRVLDGLGNPMDGLGTIIGEEQYPVFNLPLSTIASFNTFFNPFLTYVGVLS